MITLNQSKTLNPNLLNDTTSHHETLRSGEELMINNAISIPKCFTFVDHGITWLLACLV